MWAPCLLLLLQRLHGGSEQATGCWASCAAECSWIVAGPGAGGCGCGRGGVGPRRMRWRCCWVRQRQCPTLSLTRPRRWRRRRWWRRTVRRRAARATVSHDVAWWWRRRDAMSGACAESGASSFQSHRHHHHQAMGGCVVELHAPAWPYCASHHSDHGAVLRLWPQPLRGQGYCR